MDKTNPKHKNGIPRPHPQVAATVVDGEAVIVMADSGMMTVLNETATHIWQLCDGKHTVAEITAALTSEFEVTAEQASIDVYDFLERLIALQAVLITE